MKALKQRIFKNWKSSLCGFTILIIGGVGLFLKLITGTEFSLLLPFVVLCFGIKDKSNTNEKSE
ncbi:MAG TPA: hypothetical protein DCS19_07405 [Flavobacterium sp.]|nr:hypothetical protein [Flavobacterium sp.]